MKIAKFVLPVIAAGFMASSAMGAVSVDWTPTPVPAGTNVVDGFTLPFGPGGSVIGNLDGYIANALTVTTTSDWTAAALLIDLTSGSIWQQPEDVGSTFHNGTTLGLPDANYFGVLPSSQYDTYVESNGEGSTIAEAGAAGDVGGDVTEFSTAQIDYSWNSLGADTNDIGANALGQITLSPDANGTAAIAITEAGAAGKTFVTVPIVNGVITPEPASLALLGLGGLAVLRRR